MFQRDGGRKLNVTFTLVRDHYIFVVSIVFSGPFPRIVMQLSFMSSFSLTFSSLFARYLIVFQDVHEAMRDFHEYL